MQKEYIVLPKPLLPNRTTRASIQSSNELNRKEAWVKYWEMKNMAMPSLNLLRCFSERPERSRYVCEGDVCYLRDAKAQQTSASKTKNDQKLSIRIPFYRVSSRKDSWVDPIRGFDAPIYCKTIHVSKWRINCFGKNVVFGFFACLGSWFMSSSKHVIVILQIKSTLFYRPA